ncbi:hypothetical protein GmHk_17G047980 [Glycine max]|nr:hypothetical protein GmHk_17G047980 [Glycine max]
MDILKIQTPTQNLVMNEMVFRQKWITTKGIDANVRVLLHDILRRKEVQNLILNDETMTDRDKSRKWKKPSQGFFKPNCYGSYLQGAAVESCGAINFNSDSIFIQTFSIRLGYCSILEVELWAIFYGLTIPASSRNLLNEILKMKGQFQ